MIDDGTNLRTSIYKTADTFGVEGEKAVQHSMAFVNDLILQGFILGFKK